MDRRINGFPNVRQTRMDARDLDGRGTPRTSSLGFRTVIGTDRSPVLGKSLTPFFNASAHRASSLQNRLDHGDGEDRWLRGADLAGGGGVWEHSISSCNCKASTRSSSHAWTDRFLLDEHHALLSVGGDDNVGVSELLQQEALPQSDEVYICICIWTLSNS